MGLGGICFTRSWSMPEKGVAMAASTSLRNFHTKAMADLPGESLGFPTPHVGALTMQQRDRRGGKAWWRSVYFSRLFDPTRGGLPQGGVLLSSFKACGEQFSLMLCRGTDGKIRKQITNSSHHPGAIFHQKARYQLALLDSDGNLVEDAPARFECGRHLQSGSHVVPPTLPVSDEFDAILTQLGALPPPPPPPALSTEEPETGMMDASTPPAAPTSHPAIRVVVVLYCFEQLLDLRNFQDHPRGQDLDDNDIDLMMLAGDSSGDSEPGDTGEETQTTRHIMTPTREASPFRDVRCRRRAATPARFV